jgi:predicted nucleic acid-binding protein
MILVDSSVMIEALRKPDPKLQTLFYTVHPAICGIVVAEVLHGARDAVHYGKLLSGLLSFPQVAMPESIWQAVGRNLWSLRSKGVSVPFQDGAIATVAIENDLELWTRDTHFQLIQTVIVQLKLFQEPP